MKRLRKTFAIVALFTMLALLVTSCTGAKTDSKASSSGNQQAAPGTGSAVKPGEKQKVVFVHWTAESNMEEPVKEFNSKNPDIEVVYKRVADSSTTSYNTILMSGDQVDVIGNHDVLDLRQRVGSGLYEPLGGYLKKLNVTIDDLCDKTLAGMEKLGGDVYAIPYSSNTFGVIYNKKMFQDAGIPLPDGSWTWEEFREIAKKLTKGDGANKTYGYLPNYKPQWSWLAKLSIGKDAWYKSAKETNFDNPAFVESLNNLYQMTVVDKSAWPLAEYQALKLETDTNKMFMFTKQRVAMTIGPSFFLKYTTYPEAAFKKDFEIGVTTVPKLSKDAKLKNPINYTDMSIPKSSKVKDAAWKWVKFFTIDRPDLCTGSKGQMPGTLIKDDKMMKAFDELIFNYPGVDNAASKKVYRDDLAKFEIIPEQPVDITVANKELEDMAWSIASRVFLGELKPEAAMKEMKQKGDAILAQAK